MQYEYNTVYFEIDRPSSNHPVPDIHNLINENAAHGWELVCISHSITHMGSFTVLATYRRGVPA